MTRRTVTCKDGMVQMETICPECHRKFTSKPFATDAWNAFKGGGVRIQDAFPDWTPAERELHFLSGLCSECWRSIFGTVGDAE